MLEFSLFQIMGIIILGAFIGFLSGLFGVGGGFLMTPALKIIFGIPYNIAIGSDIAAITITSMYGMYKHYKMAHINFMLGIIILCSMVPGVEIGARILGVLKTNADIDLILSICFFVVLSAAGFIMFLEYRKWAKGDRVPRDLSGFKTTFYFFKKNKNQDYHEINVPGLLACGLFIGILNGLLGVGGGFIIVPILVNFFAIPAVIVIGTSLFVVCPSSAYGAVTHFFKGNVNFWLIILILSGSIIGSYFGTSISEKFRGKKIRQYFIYIILLGLLMITYNILVQTGIIK